MSNKETKNDSLQIKFGRRLFVLRAERLMTQERLAEEAGLSVDFVSLIERGRRAPSFRTLERLSEALQVPVQDLFNFEEKA